MAATIQFPRVPTVQLGQTLDRSVAGAVYGLVDRAALRRPELATALRGSVRMVFLEPYAPVRIDFDGGAIVVADDPAGTPVDLEVHAALADLVLLLSSPLAAGVPSPTTKTGRGALARWVDGRIDFRGSLTLARRVLQLLSVSAPPR